MEKGKLWKWGTDDDSWKHNIVHFGVPVAKYVDKLVKAWKKYGNIIICVDYDDTIVSHEDWNKEICIDVLNTIKEAKELGAKLILWTCRQYENIETEVMDIEMDYGFYFDEVNPTEPFKERFSNKPYCNIMLDDKCGLDQALYILKLAIEIYGEEKTKQLP